MPTRGLINPELLSGIADAIRAKNGTSAGMTPAQMAAAISNLELSEAIKQALLNCFAHVAWIDDQGQSYYDALEDALYPTSPPAELLSISAVFEQGQTVIYDTDSLDDLKPMLTVTANYSDSTSAEVTTYTLSGTLTEGTSTITVSYGGKTTTFDVTVTSILPSGYKRVEYIECSGTQRIDTGIYPAASGKIVLTAKSTDETKTNPNGIGYITSGSLNNSRASISFGGSSFHYIAASMANASSSKKLIDQDGVKHSVTLDLKNKVAFVDGSAETVSFSETTYSAQNTATFALFAQYSNSSYTFAQALQIYEFIYLENDTIVKHLYPCYRISDGVIGMYDVVTDTFFTNAGTGTFTKGADV